MKKGYRYYVRMSTGAIELNNEIFDTLDKCIDSIIKSKYYRSRKSNLHFGIDFCKVENDTVEILDYIVRPSTTYNAESECDNYA